MAHNFTTHFANCRENIACILIQIITFYYDAYFLDYFPKYLGKGMSEEAAIKRIEGDIKGGVIPLFDTRLNENILFITVNYLSDPMTIGRKQSSSIESREAVEKLFLYVTSDINDCFLESIKQVTSYELKYFEYRDVISKRHRDYSDDMSYVLKELLYLIGHGAFGKNTMLFTKKHLVEDLRSDLKSYFFKANEHTTLFDIVRDILKDIDRDMDDVDYKFALTKESIPIMLLAIANYSD